MIDHLLHGLATGNVARRAAAAGALARALIDGQFAFAERCAAEAALTVLLEDPSPKVRLALADALSLSRQAPIHLIDALASDQPEVAALVLGRSPLLGEADLVARVASGRASTQRLIAGRPNLSCAVAAALAEVADADACLALLANPSAEISPSGFRRMADRLGHIGAARKALAADPRLPPDCRHTLIVKLGGALASAPLVAASLGPAGAERAVLSASVAAVLMLIDDTPADLLASLADHLRRAGALTAEILVRVVAAGQVDFFGAALVSLTGQSSRRVQSLLARGGDVAVAALLGQAGLTGPAERAMLEALKLWREVDAGRRLAGSQEVSRLLIARLGEQDRGSEIAELLTELHRAAVRENALGHGRALAAA